MAAARVWPRPALLPAALGLALLVAAFLAALPAATTALRVTPAQGPQLSFDSALVTFGHNASRFAEVTASVASVFEVSAAGGCGVVLPPGLRLDATNVSIAVCTLGQILEKCHTYSQFLRKIQQIPGIAGTMTRVGYTITGMTIKTAAYWYFNENTDDITMIVNEIPANVWNVIAGQAAAGGTVTLTQERGVFYDRVLMNPNTRVMFDIEGTIWVVFVLTDIWLAYSVIARAKQVSKQAEILINLGIFSALSALDNFVGEPLGPTLLWYIDVALFWMNVMVGLMCYTLVILQWSKTVHSLHGSGFVVRHEKKIVWVFCALIPLMALLQCLRFAINSNASLIATIVIAGIIIFVESILLFVYGVRILIVLMRGAAIRQLPPTPKALEHGASPAVVVVAAAGRSTDDTDQHTDDADRASTPVHQTPPPSLPPKLHPRTASRSEDHDRDHATLSSDGSTSGGYKPRTRAPGAITIRTVREELTRNSLNRNLTILTLVASLSLLIAAVIMAIGGIAGRSEGLYYTVEFYYGFMISRGIFFFLLERALVLYIFLNYWNRPGVRPDSLPTPRTPRPAAPSPPPLTESLMLSKITQPAGLDTVQDERSLHDYINDDERRPLSTPGPRPASPNAGHRPASPNAVFPRAHVSAAASLQSLPPRVVRVGAAASDPADSDHHDTLASNPIVVSTDLAIGSKRPADTLARAGAPLPASGPQPQPQPGSQSASLESLLLVEAHRISAQR